MIPTSVIVSAVLTGGVAFVFWLVQFLLEKLGNWLDARLQSFNEKFVVLTTRLDHIGTKLDFLAERFAASSVKSDTANAEIDRLRDQIEVIKADVAIVKNTQERCKACNS